MLSVILILNVVVALLGGWVLFRVTRNYIVWFFELVFVLFFVVRPIMNGYFDVPDLGLTAFGIGQDVFVTYAMCGLVFALLFHPMVYLLFRRKKLFSDHFFLLCNFDSVSKSRFTAVFIGFVTLNYALNAFKFHSLSYVFMEQDSFEAGMKLVGGLWFIQMMSSVLIFPCLVLLGRSLDAKPFRLACILFLTMAGFVAIVHPSDRTGVIGLLVAVVIYVFSIRRTHFRLVTLGAISIGAVLLVVLMMLTLNYFRMGRGLDGGAESLWLPMVGSLWSDTVPAANGIILIDYLKHHDWLYFRYLVPSLLPIMAIPSKIFPFKPPIGMEGVLTDAIFGFHLDPAQYHEGGTLTFTVPVAGYADLGYLGVMVAAILYAFFFSVFLRGWKQKSSTVRFLTLYFLILVVAGFRLSIVGLAVISYWILISTLLLYGASHFMSPSPVGIRELAIVSREQGFMTRLVFGVCAFVTICIFCLLTYALTSG